MKHRKRICRRFEGSFQNIYSCFFIFERAFKLEEGVVPDKSADKANKFKTYYNTLNRWLELKQKGVSLDKWFQKNGYKNAAVYGMGELGNRLYEELKDTEIRVEYAIDKNAYGVSLDIPVYQKEDELPDVDVIVISAVFAFSEISGELEKKCTCPIVSLEDIVFEL